MAASFPEGVVTKPSLVDSQSRLCGWAPITTQDPKLWVSFPGWQYSICEVTLSTTPLGGMTGSFVRLIVFTSLPSPLLLADLICVEADKITVINCKGEHNSCQWVPWVLLTNHPAWGWSGVCPYDWTDLGSFLWILAFVPRELGSAEGFWAEEWHDLNYVLMRLQYRLLCGG